MAADYFTQEEIKKNLDKHYKPGSKVAQDALKGITAKPVLNVTKAKSAIFRYFVGGKKIMKIRKSDGSYDKNYLIKQLRDKYKMTNLTPQQRREFAEMITGKGKVINKKALKAIEGYKKYTQRKMRDEGIGNDSAKKMARAQRIKSAGSGSFAARLAEKHNPGETSKKSKEEIKEKVLTKGGVRLGISSLDLEDKARKEAKHFVSEMETIRDQETIESSPTVFNPIGVTSAAKKGTVGVGGMNQSGNAKPINTNNKLGPGSGGSSLRGTPPPF